MSAPTTVWQGDNPRARAFRCLVCATEFDDFVRAETTEDEHGLRVALVPLNGCPGCDDAAPRLVPPDTSWVTTAPVNHPRAWGGVGRHRPLTDHGLLSRIPVPGLGQVGAVLAMVAFLATLCALVLS